MSVNKVILVGRLGKDPETRLMTNGEAVANATLATSENWKDKNGERNEKTEWHNLVFYRRLAEVAGEFLKKGSQVYIEGKIQTRKYQTKEGQERYITEIIVNEMQMLGDKKDGSDHRAPESQTAPARSAPASAAASRPAPAAASKPGYDYDSDIPFDYTGRKGSGVDWRSM